MKAFIVAVIFFGFVLGLALLSVVAPSHYAKASGGEIDED